MTITTMELRDGTRIDWEDFEYRLHDRFGVNAVTLKKNGERRTGTAISPANDICRMIKRHLAAQEQICERLKQRLIREAAYRWRHAAEECDAGIYRIMVPVLLADAIDGFVSVCGRPYCTCERIYTRYISHLTGSDTHRIQSLLSTLNPIGPRDIKAIRDFISGYTAAN